MKGDVMSLIASEYDVDEENAKQLKSWLTATGKWTREQAILLFLDIDPDRAHGDCFVKFSGHGSVQYEVYYLVEGDPTGSFIVPQYDSCGEPVNLTSAQEILLHETRRMCKKIERKINIRDSATPHEWIDLALENEITIPWLAWAIERKLYIPKQAADTLSQPKAQAGAPVGDGRGNKLRRNSLDPAIDKAIEQAGNMELADVWLKLKELAIGEERPFTGAPENGALCYTNDNDNPATLSKDALRKRLANRR